MQWSIPVSRNAPDHQSCVDEIVLGNAGMSSTGRFRRSTSVDPSRYIQFHSPGRDAGEQYQGTYESHQDELSDIATRRSYGKLGKASLGYSGRSLPGMWRTDDKAACGSPGGGRECRTGRSGNHPALGPVPAAAPSSGLDIQCARRATSGWTVRGGTPLHASMRHDRSAYRSFDAGSGSAGVLSPPDNRRTVLSLACTEGG